VEVVPDDSPSLLDYRLPSFVLTSSTHEKDQAATFPIQLPLLNTQIQTKENSFAALPYSSLTKPSSLLKLLNLIEYII
jgi:hypothetical protein